MMTCRLYVESEQKRTFLVIMKLVPIAAEPETASKRPMYLSSMVSFDAEFVNGGERRERRSR